MGGKLLNITILFCVLLVLVLTCIFLTVQFKEPAEKFFAAAPDGLVTSLTDVKEPYTTTSAVLEWASRAAVAAHTYGFNDYEESLDVASKYFTKKGWADFSSALDESNTFWTIVEKRIDVTSVVVDAAVVTAEGDLFGKHVWKIKVPLLVTYQSLSEKKQIWLVVTMLVQKVPAHEMPHGIGIVQMQEIQVSAAAV